MKKSFVILAVLVSALAALVPTGSALAAEITYVSVVGTWRDPVDNVPGSQPGDPVITNGDPTSIIRWGTTSGQQSGYDFTATLPPPFTLPGPIPFFSLGNFEHHNFAVDDPSLTSVELDVVLMIAVDGVPTGPLTFSFTFNHEETPNNPPPGESCPYPTPPGEGCTDRVTIVASPNPTTFNVGGVDYTLEMSFLDNGSAVDEFITREGGSINSSGLVGEFTLPPGLRVTKSGPTSMRLAQWGSFVLDVQNDGDSDAYDVTILDRLPDGPTGGMCDTTPEILSARVFAPDGVTPVPGKGPLIEGSDYSLGYDGAACELTFTTLSAAAVIDIDERLLITYRTQLDIDSEDGITLTNVAGATAWFSDDASNPGRIAYLRTLTDGTVGVVDHEDAHDVAVDLPVLRFEKVVMNVTTGEDPALVATPGDTLRYRLYVENLSDVPVSDFRIVDVLDNLNDPPAFAAGTLNVITAPAGADMTNTDPAGGAAGTGLLDIGNLDIGGLSETVLIEFEAELAAAMANGRFVYNQSEFLTGGIQIAVSDDPNVNGQADPDVAGDEDPTRVQIESAPYFDIDKISTYLDGDPNMLLAGERLRYTITVKNVGTEDATDAWLRDSLPINTAYLAGSTTLNGAAVPDSAGGGFPLQDGIDLHAPEDPTPGYLRADTAPTADNVATITFDVVVAADLADGTVISNQAFLNALTSGVADQPSDDPRTAVVDDPTQDVVGNYPALFAVKTAVLEQDYSSPGIVDPGDTLRYTIQVQNNGAVPATMVRLVDVVPTDTTYVADSLTLNGLPVGQPDSGVFPLEAGIWISSTDLTPPVPAPGEGTISPREAATVEFVVRVNDAVPRGTLITNQATVSTDELGDLLTDGDGNPATGPEPTIVVVGDAQQLTITKQVIVVGGGPALAGSTLEYVVTVRNAGAVPALDVYVRDDLDEPVPDQLVYVDQSATMRGSSAGISVVGPVLTANFSAEYGPLPPGAAFILRFRARIDDALPIGTTVTNVAHVTWDTDQTAYAEAIVDVGGMLGTGILTGRVWHDTNYDDVLDPVERLLEGWTVELYRNDELVLSTLTDDDGAFRFSGVAPNYLTTDVYTLTFLAPGATPASAALGYAASSFTNAPQRISDIQVRSGSFTQALNLPIDPNGIVYDALSRLPLAGATLTLTDPVTGIAVPAACFDDPNQQGQVTFAGGYYKFDLNFSDPACPSGAAYRIEVDPGPDYEPEISEFIPPAADPTSQPFNVPLCAGGASDAVPATADHCEVLPSEFAPALAIAPGAGTAYYLGLILDDTRTPGSSQAFNNHIPLDPSLTGLVAITKTTPMVNVSRGQMVPYTLTVRSSWTIDFPGVDVVDRYPVGFKYIEGSARVDGQPLEPELIDGELIWQDLTLTAEGEHTIELLLAPGAGLVEGEYTNRAQAHLALTGEALSPEASATVRLVPDPTFDCTDVTGKVFNDNDRNGIQNDDEFGIQGVRLVTPTGLAALTDQHGRFHITCAVTPHDGRGSNFMLKLDDRTLPSGFRTSTRPFQIKRATRGKALHFSFGASIFRVVGLDVADPVFQPDSTDMRPQWRPRVELLVDELVKAPAILRLSYLADVEDPKLVDRRVKVLRKMIRDAWDERDTDYRLAIEHEVFWRMGKPPEKDRRLTAGREENQ